MGMFDYVVDVDLDCPFCGEKLSDFQSKDFPYPGLQELSFKDVRRFHTGCEKCNSWFEFQHLSTNYREDMERCECCGQYISTLDDFMVIADNRKEVKHLFIKDGVICQNKD